MKKAGAEVTVVTTTIEASLIDSGGLQKDSGFHGLRRSFISPPVQVIRLDFRAGFTLLERLNTVMNWSLSAHELHMVPFRTMTDSQDYWHRLHLSSTHNLTQIIRRPPRLRKTQTPLDTLQHLPRHLISQDMRFLITPSFLRFV